MSTESDIAGKITQRGLSAILRVLTELDGLPRDDWSKTHVRDITDCVLAAVKVQAEEREQLNFEREHNMGDLRDLLKQYLASLPPAEVVSLVEEVANGKEVHA